MIFDTHAHLTDEKFDGDVEKIVGDFYENNIEGAICVGYDLDSSLASFELASTYENLYAAVGIHPHDSQNATKDNYLCFEKLAKDKKVVAIGEIGLDYYYDLSPRDVQQKVFVEQLELAHSLHLPVALHVRDAYEDMRKLLFENENKLRNGFVLHCYSGSLEMAKVFSKLDAVHFSFGGSLTFKNAKQNANVLQWLPKDRLLLETDCPYLTPVPFRGKRNEPKMIKYVVDKMTEILGESQESIIERTNKNTKKLFTKII